MKRIAFFVVFSIFALTSNVANAGGLPLVFTRGEYKVKVSFESVSSWNKIDSIFRGWAKRPASSTEMDVDMAITIDGQWIILQLSRGFLFLDGSICGGQSIPCKWRVDEIRQVIDAFLDQQRQSFPRQKEAGRTKKPPRTPDGEEVATV